MNATTYTMGSDRSLVKAGKGIKKKSNPLQRLAERRIIRLFNRSAMIPEIGVMTR
jgi:hypothetical protein